ncbi:hypothetical protein LIA77_08459 [Sarocladium implicatum]|nr:hypothetical protein LIA77_08459 [Sarocladium implicatum]
MAIFFKHALQSRPRAHIRFRFSRIPGFQSELNCSPDPHWLIVWHVIIEAAIWTNGLSRICGAQTVRAHCLMESPRTRGERGLHQQSHSLLRTREALSSIQRGFEALRELYSRTPVTLAVQPLDT